MPTSLQQTIAAVALFFLTACAFAAEPDPAQNGLVQATLLANVDAAAPGASFTLGVRLKLAEHWHTYWINPGETGSATHITLHGPAGLEFGSVGFPLPTKIEAIGGVAYGYENEVLFLIPVKVTKDFKAKGVTLEANVEWGACQKEECVEGSAKLTITLPISETARPANADLFHEWAQRLPGRYEDFADLLASVKAVEGADGMPVGLSVEWKHPAPAKVEFFPISTDAAAIQDIAISSAGTRTGITFKTVVYNPAKFVKGRLDSVLVYEDAMGRRHGIPFSVRILRGTGGPSVSAIRKDTGGPPVPPSNSKP